jgi:hypothetical protein
MFGSDGSSCNHVGFAAVVDPSMLSGLYIQNRVGYAAHAPNLFNVNGNEIGLAKPLRPASIADRRPLKANS